MVSKRAFMLPKKTFCTFRKFKVVLLGSLNYKTFCCLFRKDLHAFLGSCNVKNKGWIKKTHLTVCKFSLCVCLGICLSNLGNRTWLHLMVTHYPQKSHSPSLGWSNHPPQDGHSPHQSWIVWVPTIPTTVARHNKDGHQLSPRQSPTILATYKGWAPNIPWMVTHHSQNCQPPSLEQSPTIPRMVSNHPQDGHPPSHEQSCIITKMVTHHPQNVCPQSPKWPPTIPRLVTHYP